MSSGQPCFGLSQPRLSSTLLRSYTHMSGESSSRCSLSLFSMQDKESFGHRVKTGFFSLSVWESSAHMCPGFPSQPRPGAQVLWGSISRAVFLTPPFPPCSAGLSPSSAPTVTFLASGGLPLCVQAEPPDLALRPRSGLSGEFCSITAL